MIGGYNNRQMAVVVHVYDIAPQNDILYPLGLGFYHSGIVVDGQEYTFSQSGVFSHTPRDLNGSEAKFRESIVLGSFKGSSSDIKRVVDDLKKDFKGVDYHIMNRNCNSFANAFSRKLIGQPIPAYINRMAECGSFFSCIVNPIINGISNSQNQSGANQPMLTSSVNRSSSSSSSSSGVSNINRISTPFSGSSQRLGKLL